jgi:MFS family permease
VIGVFRTGRWTSLVVTALALVLCLSTWFSATSVAPTLVSTLNLQEADEIWLTNAVQAGFVFGALLSSFLSISDAFNVSRVMSVGAFFAALTNLLLIAAIDPWHAIAARFLTGCALAFVYPPALKYISTWFRKARGIAMGLIVGSLTIGSALPHFINGLGSQETFTFVIICTSAAALLAGGIFWYLPEGPFSFGRANVDVRQIGAIVRNKPVMLANLGYFGHMWELYAMWGWIYAYSTSAMQTGVSLSNVSILAFSVIAFGAPGCVIAGLLSDKIGRCYTTSIMLTLSGVSALMIGCFFTGPSWVFVMIALIWGFTVVADSAQFSASVSELSDQKFVGSALTFQMAIGFLITLFTVWLVPQIASLLGSWRWSFAVLSIGPIVGVFAMIKLRQMPDAIKMANGRR